MTGLVSYERVGDVAVLGLDDGKANVMSPAMLAQINAALDQVESEGAVVLIVGREGMFSGGFDLRVLRGGGMAALGMLRSGFELSERLLSFPYPVVVASTGHAVAMGLFVVLSADYALGAAGEFRYQANEVAIGLTLPRAAVEICRQRLAPAHFNRAVLLSESYGPDGAVAAGMLDRVVEAGSLRAEALAHAQSLADLDLVAHARTKLRVRGGALRALRRGLGRDMRELSWLGVRRLVARRLGRTKPTS